MIEEVLWQMGMSVRVSSYDRRYERQSHLKRTAFAAKIRESQDIYVNVMTLHRYEQCLSAEMRGEVVTCGGFLQSQSYSKLILVGKSETLAEATVVHRTGKDHP